MLAFGDRELVDGEAIVVIRIVEVDEPDLVMNDATIGLVIDVDPIHEHPVKPPIVFEQIRRLGAKDASKCLIASLFRNMWIGSLDRLPESPHQHHIAK